MAASPDDERCILAGLVMIIDVKTGKKLHELEGPTEGIEWLRWHPVGDFVVAGSEDFTAWMWNAALAKCMTVREAVHQSAFCTQHVTGPFRSWRCGSALLALPSMLACRLPEGTWHWQLSLYVFGLGIRAELLHLYSNAIPS